MASIIGIGESGQRNRDHLPDHAKLAMAGHFTRWTRNPDGLECAIATYFKVPVFLQEFRPHYLNIEVDRQTRLSRFAGQSQLGIDAVLGMRVPDAQCKFTLRLGPLSLAQYERFQPGGSDFPGLLDWVRNYVGIEYAWDFVLVLNRNEVPALVLGGPSRIGLTCWFSHPSTARDPDPEDYVLDPEAWIRLRDGRVTAVN